jgi:CheY-like chemotaxis protein
MSTILVAAAPEPRDIVQRILAGHDLGFAETLSQAVRALGERDYDLIVCTVAFDESKLFELLRLVKAESAWRSIPFVCARVRPQILRSRTALEAVAFTCRQLGAAAFLDIADYEGDSERGMRDEIEALLGQAPVSKGATESELRPQQ